MNYPERPLEEDHPIYTQAADQERRRRLAEENADHDRDRQIEQYGDPSPLDFND